MNVLYKVIGDVVFEMLVEIEIEKYLNKRVFDLSKKMPDHVDVKITCKKMDLINYKNKKFLHQQEPDISEKCYYREIFDLGVFEYFREEKRMEVKYSVNKDYQYDSCEVVVDTILQFMYLIMLEFNIVPLHSSALGYGKSGLLIFGNSGAGKTTLEVALLNCGFQFFADDVIFIDKNNNIYNSGEQIIACLEGTRNIIKNSWGVEIGNTSGSLTEKSCIRVDESKISINIKLKPSVIIFPVVSDTGERLERMSKKAVFLEIIKLSISEKFSLEQKELYMKRIRMLTEEAIGLKYYRTDRVDNCLENICAQILQICKNGSESI